MGLFDNKKKRVINVDGKSIELEPKPGISLFGGKPKQPEQQKPAQPAQPAQPPKPAIPQKPEQPKQERKPLFSFGAKEAPKPPAPKPAPVQTPVQPARPAPVVEPKPQMDFGGISIYRKKEEQPQQPAPRPLPTAPQPPAPKPQAAQPQPRPERKPLFSFGKKPEAKPAAVPAPRPQPVQVPPPAPRPQPPPPQPQSYTPPSPSRVMEAAKPQVGLGEINIYRKKEEQKPAAPAPQRFGQQVAQRPKPQAAQQAGPSAWKLYLSSVAAKHKGLEEAIRKQGIKGSVTDFVQRMMLSAAMLSAVVALTLGIIFVRIGLPAIEAVMFAVLLGFTMFYVAFNVFLNFPTKKGKASSKIIERDILFATRDMIISLRSGMPLFNAITAVSTGYGEASKEFRKIIERVQLGQPLEEAIDATVAESRSVSFRRIMLQAAVSIKAGADVVAALQSVIDQLSQERIIELRRYGQRLNAIAMFYMLFGIILPSMGIAVATILTTFIAIFTITPAVLAGGLVGIIFLQIIFLQMIRSSRPVFAM